MIIMVTYNKNIWNDGDIITVDKLNNLENGILSIVDSVNTANTSINDISNKVNTITDTVNTISETVNISNIKSNIQEIRARINRLENHVILFNKYGDISIIDSISNTSTVTSNKKVVLFELDINNINDGILNVTGKGIVLTGCDSESVAIRLNSSEDVIISDNRNGGELDKSIANASVSIDTNESIMINDYIFSQLSYNGLEIGLNDTAPKKITIKNCDFIGDLSNNAISIFATADDCVVTIENCHFTKVSNVLRLSNRTNANNVIVNFVNCSWDQLDSDTERKGVVVCKDYTSTSKEEAIEVNRFGNNKIAISFTDCVGENNTLVTLAEDDSSYVTGDNCLVYVQCNKWDNETSGKVSHKDMPEMFPIVAA